MMGKEQVWVKKSIRRVLENIGDSLRRIIILSRGAVLLQSLEESVAF